MNLSLGKENLHEEHEEISVDDFRVVYDGLTGGKSVTTGRLVPFCLFTDPEFARVGLSEKEAKARGVAYRLFKIPMEAVMRASTLSETRGFLKALVELAGARVIVHYGCAAAEADALVKEIRATGGQADAASADLSLPDGVAGLGTEVRAIAGEQLDVLVSNAGISKAATIRDHTVEYFDRLFATNVRGPFFLIQHLLPVLRGARTSS